MTNTKLFKIFNNRYCFLVICVIAVASSCEVKKSNPDPTDFLKGKWTFKSIETTNSENLDTVARRIYNEQMAEFIQNSIFKLSDSTYFYTLGENKENGLWKYDPNDSVLSLKSSKGKVQMFRINANSTNLKLKLMNSGSNEYWVLEK